MIDHYNVRLTINRVDKEKVSATINNRRESVDQRDVVEILNVSIRVDNIKDIEAKLLTLASMLNDDKEN